MPLLIIGTCIFVIVFMTRFFPDALHKWGFSLKSQDIPPVDENLPNFFEAVKLADADWVVYENQNLRQVYGFTMVPIWLETRLDDW